MSDLDRLYGPTGPKKYSSAFIVGFGVSLLLMGGYVLGYALFFLIFANAFPETGSWLTVWLPPVTVGVTVSVVACLPMRRMKRTVTIPIGMGFLAFYYAALALGLVSSSGLKDGATALYVVSLFCLPCVIPGNIMAWIMWRRFPGEKKEDLE